jgi:hypothetical protein
MVQPGLGHSPVVELAGDRDRLCRVADAIAAHPHRTAGFAALPTADPNAAEAELADAVDELGFKGGERGLTLEGSKVRVDHPLDELLQGEREPSRVAGAALLESPCGGLARAVGIGCDRS